MELGLEIQKAAHSSVCPPLSFQNPADRQVTDARATMALYRLHKVEWEQSVRPQTEAYRAKMGIVLGKGKDSGGKRKRDDESESEEGDDDEEARQKRREESRWTQTERGSTTFERDWRSRGRQLVGGYLMLRELFHIFFVQSMYITTSSS
jgi:hypothetical protein